MAQSQNKTKKIEIRHAGGGALIVTCCTLVAAAVGAAVAARCVRNRGNTKVKDGEEEVKIREESEIIHVEEEEIPDTGNSSVESDTEQVYPNQEELEINGNLEIEPNLDTEGQVEAREDGEEREEVFEETEDTLLEPNTQVLDHDAETDLLADAYERFEGAGETNIESKIEKAGTEEVILDQVEVHDEFADVSLEPSIEAFDQNLEIKEEEDSELSSDVDSMRGEEGSDGTYNSSLESIAEQVWPSETTEDEVKQTIHDSESLELTLDDIIAQVGVDDDNNHLDYEVTEDAISSSGESVDNIQQEQVFADGLEGSEETVQNYSEMDTNSIKDDVENANIEEEERTCDVTSSAELVEETNFLVSVKDTDTSCQLEIPETTEKTSVAFASFLPYNPMEEELPLNSSPESKAMEIEVAQSITKMVMELGAKMDNDDVKNREGKHEDCNEEVASRMMSTAIVEKRTMQNLKLISSEYRIYILLVLALGLVIGLLAFAQPDSFRYGEHRVSDMYQKVAQIFVPTYQRAMENYRRFLAI